MWFEARGWQRLIVQSEVVEAVGLVEAFAALVRKQAGTTLKDWQEKALNGASIELARFAEGLGRDQGDGRPVVGRTWPRYL
jgi:hypothetical protein